MKEMMCLLLKKTERQLVWRHKTEELQEDGPLSVVLTMVCSRWAKWVKSFVHHTKKFGV